MRVLVCALLLAPAVASAGIVLNHQGRLLGPQDAPVTGSVTLTVNIWTNELAGSTPAWKETYDVLAQDGLYAIALGDTKEGTKAALTPDDVAGDRWISVTIAGNELKPRQRIGATPYAALAAKAERAILADEATHAADATHADAADEATHAAAAAKADALSATCDGCVDTAHLAAKSVTLDRLATDANGKLVGLDADKLDGVDLATLRTETADATRLTTGTLAGDRLSGEYAKALQLTNAGNTVAAGVVNTASLQAGIGQFSGSLRVPTGTTLPECNAGGLVFFHSGELKTYVCDGTAWKKVGVSANSLQFTANLVAFGSAAAGATQTVTVRNAGDAVITTPMFNTVGPFDVTANTCGATLAAAATCEATVTFTPGGTNAGLARGLVTVFSPAGGSASVPVTATFAPPKGTASDPATSCKAIKAGYPTATTGTYKLDADGSGSKPAYDAYCDMDTDGGGWTLVLKVDGGSATLNRTDVTRWRLKGYIGDISRLTLENALGRSYEDVAFSDVLIRSVYRPSRNLAWRHPRTYPSLFSVVDAGQRVSDGNRLFGSIDNLDYSGSFDRMNECQGLKFGFFTYDYTQNGTGIVGFTMTHGHIGAVVGASIFTDNHPANYDANDLNIYTRCVTDFGIGASYSNQESGGRNIRNMQSHWWGDGNTGSDFRMHGLFVR